MAYGLYESSVQPKREGVIPHMYRNILDNGSEMYCVEGLGMVFCHHQRWQAEIKLHYMLNAVGLDY
jgi:hypothetical protein